MKLIDADKFKQLVLLKTPFIDVRAPIEFKEGSIPGAVNLPILNDEERHLIGIEYKTHGQAAAIDLGHRLVNGAVKAERVEAWVKALENNPSAIIYCFRGGLRSQMTQTWLAEAGVKVPIVSGGYKALRRFCLQSISELSPRLNLEIVSGPTGAGKTKFLHDSGRAFIDLEGIACHRGSAFGAMPTPQPSQIDFENQLAFELIRLSELNEPILVEDESQMVGYRYIPDDFFNRMKQSPKKVLEVSLEVRVSNILKDYLEDSKLGEHGDISRFDDFRKSIKAISKKLGGLRTQEILNDLDLSQKNFLAGEGLESNRIWIRKLLLWYYDPRYERVPESFSISLSKPLK